MFEIAGSTELSSLGSVERITLGKRVLGVVPMPVHCYRLGSTLVDAGPPKSLDDLADRVDLDAIEHVVLTHHHEDHVGAAARLDELGATVHAPEASLEALREPPEIEPYQHRVWGQPDPVDAEPLGDTVQTPDAELEIHPVPGHSPDHVALLDRETELLFAGDAYLPARETLRADEDLAGFLESLATMQTLEAEAILPGHGSVVEEPAPAIAEVLEHFRDLADRARELDDEGQAPASVRRELLGFEGFITYYTGGHYAKQNLVDELLALPADTTQR